MIFFDVRSVLLSTRDSRRPAGTMKEAGGRVVVAAVEAMVESSCWKRNGVEEERDTTRGTQEEREGNRRFRRKVSG